MYPNNTQLRCRFGMIFALISIYPSFTLAIFCKSQIVYPHFIIACESSCRVKLQSVYMKSYEKYDHGRMDLFFKYFVFG